MRSRDLLNESEVVVKKPLVISITRMTVHNGPGIRTLILLKGCGAVCEFAKGLLSLVAIHLLPLHHLGKARYAALGREYPIDGIPLIQDEVLRKIKAMVESYGLTCSIIG